MAFDDYKREPVARRLKRIWQENNGNWLLVTALAVSLLTWSLGYFDLMPEITANRRANVPSVMATGKTLIVRIMGCASDQGRVVALLYHAEHFSPDSVPLRIETLEIRNKETIWTMHNLPFGAYVAFAFQDVNEDEQLSPGVERQGFSHRPAELRPLAADDPSATLTQAAFFFGQDKQEVVVELSL